MSKLTCRFHYAITREREDGRSTLLAKGFTVHACINREGKLTRFPEPVLEKIQAILEKGNAEEQIS